ncbi:putative pectate lyase F [Ceratocystis fimbriata CBS 114723]|uniref:Pectate lyase n=1 Tax=Ceratocystis fimbriata CBS 114723 TaxID=1035309 RepID=A0A2C5WZD6_9PEZI|nr:putative pectate lyase F [Ceratocystis fimbriata CBS 114723]
MQFSNFFLALAAIPMAMGYSYCPTKSLPAAKGYKALKATQYITKGSVYDAKYFKIDRGVACTAQTEGGEKDAVFVLEAGATLRNVIIGAKQREGVYCIGPCTLENVWFEDVCEDAISIKGNGLATISGGGAFKAADKVIQHNGCGHVNVVDFYAEDYGKVYRSCGNCVKNCARTVHMSGVTALNGGELMGINPNLGDKATYENNCSDAKTECQAYKGCDKSKGACESPKAGKC